MAKIIDFLSILEKKKQQQLWLERIWQWADRFDIEEYNVPRNRDELLNLTHLSFQSIRYFERDKFTELPKEFGNLTNLKFLELGSLVHPEIVLNYLTELPKEIGKLTNLTHLYIQDNNLTELPKEIRKLTQLKDLKLGFNHLTQLPKEIGNLKQLEILTMWQNSITELPQEIGNLKQLKGFSIWGNPLEELPQEIVNLTELKKIELGKNLRINALQKKWIKKLQHDGCEISYI